MKRYNLLDSYLTAKFLKQIIVKLKTFLQVRDNHLQNSVSLYIPSYKKDKHFNFIKYLYEHSLVKHL